MHVCVCVRSLVPKSHPHCVCVHVFWAKYVCTVYTVCVLKSDWLLQCGIKNIRRSAALNDNPVFIQVRMPMRHPR